MYVDGSRFVSIVEELINLATQEQAFKFGAELPFFTTRVYFSTSWGTFTDVLFKKLMLSSLQGAVESGLQSRWIFYTSVRVKLDMLVEILKTWTMVENKSNNSTIKLKRGQILSHLFRSRGSLKSNAHPKRIYLELFFTLITPMMHCIAISVCVFVVELSWVQIIRLYHKLKFYYYFKMKQ